MKNYLLINKLLIKSREYIFIILIATILLLISFSKSFSEENIFTVDNVEVEGKIDLNFSRDKFINKAFLKSFKELMAKIILSSDLEKIKNIRLDKIKNLINSFQILEERYQTEEYKAVFKVSYNGKKVKNFLNKKNISFSQPKEKCNLNLAQSQRTHSKTPPRLLPQSVSFTSVPFPSRRFEFGFVLRFCCRDVCLGWAVVDAAAAKVDGPKSKIIC